MTTLSHITLNTGHVRQSAAAEVDPVIMVTVRGLVQRIVRKQLGHPVAIPGIRGFHVSGQSASDELVATVWHAIDVPVVTIGVAPSGTGGLWSLLHQGQTGLKTSADSPPKGPWIAGRLEIGLMTVLSASQWLGDFERCLGHAWMETLTINN